MTDQLIPAWRDGRLTPVDKIKVHRLGLRHPAVSVFLRVGDDFLFQQRAAQKYHSGLLWANTCCTHAHWGEAPEACARRRMREELGVANLALAPLGQVEYRADVGNGMVEHELVDVFLATLPERPALAPDSAEVADTRWASLAEFDAFIAANPGQVTPWLKLYLSEHRDALFGPLDQAADKPPRKPGRPAG